MINKATKRIVSILLENEKVSSEEVEIYQYAVECLLLKIISFMSILFVAVVMNCLFEYLIIVFAFSLIRRNAGGYHSKTRIGCFVFSLLLFAFTMIVLKVEIGINIDCFLLLIQGVIIMILSPVDTKNRRMDKLERRFFKKQTIFSTVFLLVVYFIINRWVEHYSRCIVMGMGIESVLLILGMISNKSRFVH
jgi:accessory gene regulator B